MRTILVLSALAFVAVAGVLLVWRPVTALALAMLCGAVSLWRMKAPAQGIRPTAPAERPPAAAPAAPPPSLESHPALSERVRAAGWTLEPAARGAPWLVAVRGAVRVALRPSPSAPRASAQDIMDALSAKRSETAQYAAIICSQRPEEHVAERARQAQVHMINLARLEAYLTLAGTFRPSQPAPMVQNEPMHA